MTSRREFLEAAAFSALPAFAVRAGRADATSRSPFQMFLTDERHPQARAAGAHVARTGATVHAIQAGDVTRVWLSHLRPAWQDRPAAIAGLTERAALFCLEQLGWAAGLRVIFHAEHVVDPDGSTEHAVWRGGEAAGLSARGLKQAGPQWPTLVAAAMASYRTSSPRSRYGPSLAPLAPDLPGGARLLTSWIIAAA